MQNKILKEMRLRKTTRIHLKTNNQKKKKPTTTTNHA